MKTIHPAQSLYCCLSSNQFTYYTFRSDPLAHKVFGATKSLIKKIGIRFLKPELVDDITDEALDDETKYVHQADIFLGFSTKNLLKKKFNDGDIPQMQYDKFMNAVVAFFRESLRYILLKMDMTETFWQHAKWIDFFDRQNARWSDVEYFTNRFTAVLQFDDQEIERLFEEFIEFKSLSDDELPSNALNDATISTYDDGSVEYRMDTIWYYLQEMRSVVGNEYRFRLLFRCALMVLLTPHSNAGIERVFSLVNKNKSDGSDRNRLDIEGSLSSVLAVKLDRPESFSHCTEYDPDSHLLEAAKKATVKYNKRKSSTEGSS